ncbi:Rieske (2Fe-2S) protein [Paracoccus siganidrum]|uniref:Rieske (2Fe-2S) protein n=1 Tax=Paracoccus siganidrum TaxID=1276757 RepID=A0A419A657_9RHOB|nr:Rieske (2Fe-2S) protein [Paracoccus siganidrum]RJL13090.1 Rieske (2Fe-2S) protein [Paracoccus siganidrum]RMC33046.1 Rieske (2Fe-2S) protein [Paracoccus siganidrum]
MPPDQWNAVALDSQIRASSSNPVIVNDYAVALWRSASGQVNAWEDRCPHRGMRLSLGFVEGEQLRCIYHGWGYAPDGQCRQIPAHPDLTPPKTICARRHAVERRYGLIWTNLADDPQAALPDLGADEGWVAVRSIFLTGGVQEARKAVAGDLAEWDGTVSDGDVVTLEMPDGTRLAAAFQPVDAGSTGVHFVARGPAATAEGRHGLARQVVQLRNRIENN